MHYKKECCCVHPVPGMVVLVVVLVVLVVVLDLSVGVGDFRVGQAFFVNCLFTLNHVHFFKH